MNYRIFWLPAIISIMLSCQPRQEADTVIMAEDSDTVAQVVEKAIPGDCYLTMSGKDSILMRVVIEKNTVGGHLHYRFVDKDKSGGKLFGYLKGDTLVADYKFMSEGMESEREVVFLRTGDDFIEGYGDLEEKNGRMVFKNLSAVKFTGQLMKKTNCDSLAWYFNKK